jgi:hypothetical protein
LRASGLAEQPAGTAFRDLEILLQLGYCLAASFGA